MVLSGVISSVTIIITHIRGRITTHEPLSRVWGVWCNAECSRESYATQLQLCNCSVLGGVQREPLQSWKSWEVWEGAPKP